jgi:hypothetical protein
VSTSDVELGLARTMSVAFLGDQIFWASRFFGLLVVRVRLFAVVGSVAFTESSSETSSTVG